MDDATNEAAKLDELRALLHTVGPRAVLASIGDACAETARARDDDEGEAWASAASLARDAAAALDGEEEEEEGDADEDEEREEDDGEKDEDESAVSDEEAVTSAPLRKRTRMAKEDQLGPRPPMATHWRCRRIEDEGKKPTLLFHDDGGGFAICEWPIKMCTPETIRQRWGASGGSFVVQFIHADENGQRRPCGRSRVLVLSPPAALPAPDPAAAREEKVTAPAPVVAPMRTFPSPAPSSQADSFAQVFSLLAYMQERDEKVRATTRDEARLANERYKADIELMIERDRLASKERIAQIEATARTVARASGAAPGFDPEVFAQRIGEVVGEKLGEFYDGEEEDEPAPGATPGDASKVDLATVMSLLNTYGPALMALFKGNPPIVENPSPGYGATGGPGGADGAQ